MISIDFTFVKDKSGKSINSLFDYDKVKAHRVIKGFGLDIKNYIKRSFSVDDTRITSPVVPYSVIAKGQLPIHFPNRRKYPRRRRGFLWRSIKVEDTGKGGVSNPLSTTISIYSNNKYSEALEKGTMGTAIIPLQPSNYYRKPIFNNYLRIGKFLVTKLTKTSYRPEYLITLRKVLPYNFFIKGRDAYLRTQKFQDRVDNLIKVLIGENK